MSWTGPPFVVPSLGNVTGPGNASLYACWASQLNYRDNYISGRPTSVSYNVGISTWINKTPTITVNSCDGIPRASGVPATRITVTITNVTTTRYNYTTIAKPTCTISKQGDCSSIYQGWTSLTSSYLSSTSAAARAQNTTVFASFIWDPITPPCTKDSDIIPCPTSPSLGETAVNCKITASSPTLVYWPTKADPCNPDNIAPTATEDPQPTRTAVYRGATVTSPTALLIMQNARANFYSSHTTDDNWPWTQCGRQLASEATVRVVPGDLSTVSWLPETSSAAPMNLANLDAPPWSLYANYLRTCSEGLPRTQNPPRCATVWADYSPLLYMPAQATAIPGAPSNCRVEGQIDWTVTYIPITAETMDLPQTTRWGLTSGAETSPTPISDGWNS